MKPAVWGPVVAVEFPAVWEQFAVYPDQMLPVAVCVPRSACVHSEFVVYTRVAVCFEVVYSVACVATGM